MKMSRRGAWQRRYFKVRAHRCSRDCPGCRVEDHSHIPRRTYSSCASSPFAMQLNNHFLLYYDNQNSANSGGKLPAGAINLSMASAARG